MAKIDRLLGMAEQHFDSGEQALQTVFGAYETKIMGSDSVRNGILIATDRRILFYAKKLTGFEIESFSYANISSFEMGKNMLGGTISFFASGNSVKVKWIKEGNVPAFVDTVRARMESATSKEVSPSIEGRPKEDPIKQLERLGKLHEAGVLTDTEFASKKADILGRI
ncbi:MAG: PH domain-containing protein [Spirochaetaceae bacterium]|nr:PH domain-containing protein [Spirochaetaceae bacterium]